MGKINKMQTSLFFEVEKLAKCVVYLKLILPTVWELNVQISFFIIHCQELLKPMSKQAKHKQMTV